MTTNTKRTSTGPGFFLLCLVLVTCNSNAQFLLPEVLNKACAFVMEGDKSLGSGFFIRAPETNLWMTYFITAKHVAILGKYGGGSSRLRLRINRLGGNSAEVVSIPLSLEGSQPWLQHTNPAVDIAVFPVLANWPADAYDVLYLYYLNTGDLFTPDHSHKIAWVSQAFNFASDTPRKLWKVGPGTETITLGLVPMLYSPTSANIVVYRFGRIAAMPEYEIYLPGGKGAAKTFILDSPVIHGNSGGPAFALIKETDPLGGTQSTHPHLLGVVSAFVPSIRPGLLNIATQNIDTNQFLLDNAGLSHVVPVDYLIEILNSPIATKFRDNFNRAVQSIPHNKQELAAHQTAVDKAKNDMMAAVAAMQKLPQDQVPVAVVENVRAKQQELDKALSGLMDFLLEAQAHLKVFNRDQNHISLFMTNTVRHTK